MKSFTAIPMKDSPRDARSLAVLQAQAGRGECGELIASSGKDLAIPGTPYWVHHTLPVDVVVYWATTHPDTSTNELWVWMAGDDGPWVGVEEEVESDSRDGWSQQYAPVDHPNEPLMTVWRERAH